MKKYTANYAFTNPNFVVQNLVENEIEDRALLFVLKNVLQRGFPTIPSVFLQEQLGQIHKEEDFKMPFLFISPEPLTWHSTIKGDEASGYFPAREFLEEIIPNTFGEYAFVQGLLLPEVEINEIVGDDNPQFINQQVDFYLPQAKLIIEIDGQQHKQDDLTKVKDSLRDKHFVLNGFKVVRITTMELRNNTYTFKIEEILAHLQTNKIAKSLSLYKESFEQVKEGQLTEAIVTRKLWPSAIIRFQILLIEFLLHQYLSFEQPWRFNLIIRENEQLEGFAELAIEDLLIWYAYLFKLKNKETFVKPAYEVEYGYSVKEDYKTGADIINIDFSLFERWTDEYRLHPDLITVRTDYFGAEKNYFRVSCADPINYEVTADDKPTLEFFLENIYEKPSFREGQFPIISNVLNHEDTIGLLPTGGGKSMCYQLPCLLQPSISFVVCPIKSLMYDQESNMRTSYVTNTASITGDLSPGKKECIQNDFSQGKYLFIWISPERFQIEKFREYIAQVYASHSIAYAVIDEVHCMSEWGHDFRTSYLNLTKTIQRYCPNSKFIGLTATASVNVLKDIKVEFSRNERKIGDENIKSLLDYSRSELEFEIIKTQNKFEQLESFIEDTAVLDQDEEAGLIFTPHVNGEFGCFYISNRLNTLANNRVGWYAGSVPRYKTSTFLNEEVVNNPARLKQEIRTVLEEEGVNDQLIERIIREEEYTCRKTQRQGSYYVNIGQGISVLNHEDFKKHKLRVQKIFKDNKIPLLVATKAFGMGIDKNNIKYTLHYGIPGSVESLYQEAGRAGRWSDKDRKAKCKVLYTPEVTNKGDVNRLFDMDTRFSEIQAIIDGLDWNERKDIFKNVMLFIQSHKDVNDEYGVMELIIDNYFRAQSIETIYFHTIVRELRGIGFKGLKEALIQTAQKAIYRLRLLGIVDDWTTDFVSCFKVAFNTKEDAHVKSSLSGFIRKYQADFDIEEAFGKIERGTVLQKSMYFLLRWTFENIVYSRKQSLKTLADWCEEFESIGNEAFKRRIDNYFRFTDITFIFQHIGENPTDYQKWLEVFYSVETDVSGAETKIYIPQIEDQEARSAELERLRDSLSRFLESYRANVGLNIISGLVRLSLNDFENQDGRGRFESGLASVKKGFTETNQREVCEALKVFGKDLSEVNQENLCLALIKYYPNMAAELADYYRLIFLLNDEIARRVKQLRKLNQKLHEDFEQIGTV